MDKEGCRHIKVGSPSIRGKFCKFTPQVEGGIPGLKGHHCCCQVGIPRRHHLTKNTFVQRGQTSWSRWASFTALSPLLSQTLLDTTGMMCCVN